jgi:antitoxin component of RelBE/YafQ-DinJ toxin-antitoxin module
MSPRTGRPRVFKEARNLVLRIEAELHERLTQLASEGDVTVSELVRPLLERLARGKRRREERK